MFFPYNIFTSGSIKTDEKIYHHRFVIEPTVKFIFITVYWLEPVVQIRTVFITAS
jgi:hypothetical protein